jgi:hypothetical protein
MGTGFEITRSQRVAQSSTGVKMDVSGGGEWSGHCLVTYTVPVIDEELSACRCAMSFPTVPLPVLDFNEPGDVVQASTKWAIAWNRSENEETREQCVARSDRISQHGGNTTNNVRELDQHFTECKLIMPRRNRLNVIHAYVGQSKTLDTKHYSDSSLGGSLFQVSPRDRCVDSKRNPTALWKLQARRS